jgi:hypothetical protein
MAAPALLYEKRDGVVYLTFNRPQVRNAVNPESSAWTGEKDRDYSRGSFSGTAFQPVDLTGWKPVPLENDRTNLRHELRCHYISELSIGLPQSILHKPCTCL